MPKVIILQDEHQSQELKGQSSKFNMTSPRSLEPFSLAKVLRRKRSPAYVKTFSTLDAGGLKQYGDQVEAVQKTLREEFPEIEIGGILLGFVSKCYLGPPYEVHTLDFSGEIIQHYKAGQALPDGFEKARSIASSGRYSVIEVYVDCCRAIDDYGNVAVVT